MGTKGRKGQKEQEEQEGNKKMTVDGRRSTVDS